MTIRTVLLAAVALLCAAVAAQPAAAQLATADPFDGTIRGLKLGLSATAMPDGFINFACGSNGGIPLKPLKGWTDFKQCRADALGLYEVAIEYDNVGGHLADLFYNEFAVDPGDVLWIDKYTGTKVAGHPVILSVLFDDAGIVQGVRAVTDSRARLEQRRVSNIMAVVIRNNYDPQNWKCESLPLTNGEQPVGNSFIKQRCETVYRGDRRMILTRNFFRRAGQTGVNALGEIVDGDWESSSRWEVWSLSVKVN